MHSGSEAAPTPRTAGSSRRLWGSFGIARAQRMRVSKFPPRYQGASSPAAIQAAVIVLIMIFTLFPWAHLAEIRKTQIHRVGTGPEERSKDGNRLQENRDQGSPQWPSG